MKRVYHIFRGIAAVALIAAMTACQNDVERVSEPTTRTIEVTTAETRTTIAYEGSDVSHLRWQEGDRVAYVTDAQGDTFKSAEMKSGSTGWSFNATIPSDAKSIYVLYPVGDNEGVSLADAKASLRSSVVQIAGEEFDGSQLPMAAISAVPSGSKVAVTYECLASVLRFTVGGDEGHETESLKSLTLTANEHIVGDYTFDIATSELTLSCTEQSIKVEYQSATETGEDVLLDGKHHIYVVVPSEQFTGVGVTLETDANVYTWNDGTMDLSHPERRLYRVNLDLSKSEGAPEPEVECFTPVCSLSEVTDDGVYLIAVELDGKYYVTNNTPTDTSNYYYLTGVEVASDDNGVILSDDVMNYTWSITKRDAGYEFFSANMEKKGDTGLLLITQGGTGMFSGEDGYEGKAWFVTPATADGYAAAQQPRRYWDIELDGTGKAVIRNKYDRDVDMFPCYKYCTSHNYFTLCFEGGSDKEDVQLLKLRK
ncbi:MAG: hypothetical protein J6J64_04945 [Alistipes sp.]|nr:hypothetical protein [Alistipes sp.]